MKTHRQVHGRRPARGRAPRRGPPRHATTRPTARPRPSRGTLATCRWSHRPTSRSSRTISTTTAGAAHERHTTFLNTYHHQRQDAEELGAARSASALPGAAVLRAVPSASPACWWWWYVLRNVVCRSCAAPVGLVALVLGDLEGGRWGQRRAADVLLDPHAPAVDIVVAYRGSPRRRARPRTRRPPLHLP